MNLAELPALPCPRCGRGHDLLVWLDGAGEAAPAEHWVAATCASCGEGVHLELSDGTAAIGSLSPSTPRCFRPEVRVRQPELQVRSAPDGLSVVLEHRRWILPARR